MRCRVLGVEGGCDVDSVYAAMRRHAHTHGMLADASTRHMYIAAADGGVHGRGANLEVRRTEGESCGEDAGCCRRAWCRTCERLVSAPAPAQIP